MLINNISRRITWRSSVVLLTLIVFDMTGCRDSEHNFPPLTGIDSLRIIGEIITHRSEMDLFFKDDPNSPFRKDPDAHFDSIKWFPPNLKYYFRSHLTQYPSPQTVIVFGTKGEKRNELRYGYFIIRWNDEDHRLNVYKTLPSQDDPSPDPRLLSVWFTDSTTGNQTYGVGRYVDVGEEHSDPDYIYVIDMNKAYNPYCAYSSIYSCAIPRKEDRLPFSIVAGEMKYHF